MGVVLTIFLKLTKKIYLDIQYTQSKSSKSNTIQNIKIQCHNPTAFK